MTPDPARHSERRVVAYHLAAILAVCLVWLYGPSYALPQAPADLARLPKVDGTLTAVDERRLVLKPLEAGAQDRRLVLWIRYQDERNFQLAHLRAHAALGIPTRLFFRRVGGRDYAVWKEDAPVNASGPST